MRGEGVRKDDDAKKKKSVDLFPSIAKRTVGSVAAAAAAAAIELLRSRKSRAWSRTVLLAAAERMVSWREREEKGERPSMLDCFCATSLSLLLSTSALFHLFSSRFRSSFCFTTRWGGR